VTCTTAFYSDSGGALEVPFGGGGPVAARTDTLAPGAAVHQETSATAGAANLEGWAVANCSYPLQASLLYRYYVQGVPQGEAGVNARSSPSTEFVTFAQTLTGIAYANPSSTTTASVTITALNSSGSALGSTVLTLPPNNHGSANVGSLLGISNFTGSVQIVSTIPIISLSLNAEDFPVFSSLPPGDLSAGTPLAPGH
jgi:hypothetical protein